MPESVTFCSTIMEEDNFEVNRSVQDHTNAVEVVMERKERKLTSPIWEHFTKVKIDSQWKGVCKHCKAQYVTNSNAGTNHMKRHLPKCPLLKQKTTDQFQTTLYKRKFSEDETNVEIYEFSQDVSRRKVAEMIILHEYPLNIVNHIGFREFSHSLRPEFRMVSRNTIRSDIMKIFDVEKMKTMQELGNIKSKIAVTTDMWTAGPQKKGYMAVTAHYIDNLWNIRSRILRFVYVPCPHTSEALAKVLLDCLTEWSIDRKLSTLTVDNCSTNDRMIEILLSSLSSNDLICEGKLFHLRCSAHILNLIVKDGMELIGPGIKRIRDSVRFWVGTPKRWETFEAAAKLMNICSPNKLVTDCKTRWNSTYLMLDSALTYRRVFPSLQHLDPLYKSFPEEKDWDFVSLLKDKLKLFYDVTLMFSGTKYPTTNEFFHLVCEIKFSITQWLSCHVVEVKEMAEKMMDKFDKYWLVIHGVMAVATVLDPRFKMKLIEFYFAKIYGVEGSLLEIAKIRSICEELFKEYEKSGLSGSLSSGSGTDCTVASEFSSVGSMSTNHLMGFQQYVSSTSTNENKSELDLYFDESLEPCIGTFDILSWWKLKVGKYPTLSRIAKDLLAVPVSTVASESAFSTGGRIVSTHRSRLIPTTLEALMCAQNWLWAAREDYIKAREFPTLDDEDGDGEDESEVSQIASSSASASVHASKA